MMKTHHTPSQGTGKRSIPSHLPHQKEPEAPMQWLRYALKSLAITLAIGLFLLMTCALVAYFCKDPNQCIPGLGLFAAAMTALAGGFVAMQIHRQSALLCGLVNGLLLSAVMLLLSLFLTQYTSAYSAGISCLLHIGLLMLSVLGAYWGRSAIKAHKRKKKKRPL